ncbi:MAG: thioesterase family protein [Planctomycetota bacterium]
MSRRVQFAETDAAGVLHFSNYYRYMEEVEHAFWRSLGLSVIHNHSDTVISWPRVATSCEYFAPAYFEEELVLHFGISSLGESSLSYEVVFQRGEGRIALGKTTAVCCMMEGGTFRAVRVPDTIRSKLADFVT